ncbi:hypothetical protein [Streptomyces sp. NPDC087525]|uniref:effector-associated constant component EACC1 n=1 Tax=Streptomyces sp. NPDC087525 TaxID=3365793 RepID=UPI00380DAF6D
MTTYLVGLASPDAPAQHGLQNLAQWLRGDEEVGDHAEVDLVAASPADGEMGAAFEGVQVVLDNGFQLANLILAVALWRRAAPHRPNVVIERNGIRVIVDTDDPEKVAQIAEALGDAS